MTHFFKSKDACSVAQSSLTLRDPMDCSPPGSSVRGTSQARITRVSCHFLFQRIFPTQGSNPCLLCLLYWQVGSLPQWHLESLHYYCAVLKKLQHMPFHWLPNHSAFVKEALTHEDTLLSMTGVVMKMRLQRSIVKSQAFHLCLKWDRSYDIIFPWHCLE